MDSLSMNQQHAADSFSDQPPDSSVADNNQDAVAIAGIPEPVSEGSRLQTFVTGIGFWLPCDEAAFFDHIRDKTIGKYRTLKTNSDLDNTLKSSVYARLVAVLPFHGYTHVLPIVHPSHPEDDPYSALFCSTKQDWLNALDVTGLGLLVNANGFYLWLATYQWSDETPDQESVIQEKLRQHVYTIVGADHFSHYKSSHNR